MHKLFVLTYFSNDCRRHLSLEGVGPAAFAAVLAISLLLTVSAQATEVNAASNGWPPAEETRGGTSADSSLAEYLGIHFIEGSSTTVSVEHNGKRYVVDLVGHTIRDTDAKAVPAQTLHGTESAQLGVTDSPAGAGLFG